MNALGKQLLLELKDCDKQVLNDVDFLKVGNGAHNIHYANTLTSVLLQELGALCRDLDIPEPQATLPENVEHFQ